MDHTNCDLMLSRRLLRQGNVVDGDRREGDHSVPLSRLSLLPSQADVDTADADLPVLWSGDVVHAVPP